MIRYHYDMSQCGVLHLLERYFSVGESQHLFIVITRHSFMFRCRDHVSGHHDVAP
jgi:hypothetical protein